MVDDIDLRSYFHIETVINESHHSKRNEGSIHTTNDDDDLDEDEYEDEKTILDRSGVRKKSELFLTSTSVDDNGTFACIATNLAGSARANFTLHVVVPLDPPPPLVSIYISFKLQKVQSKIC